MLFTGPSQPRRVDLGWNLACGHDTWGGITCGFATWVESCQMVVVGVVDVSDQEGCRTIVLGVMAEDTPPFENLFHLWKASLDCFNV